MPPPGTNPSERPAGAPFSTSLKPPSPENTTSASQVASAASSVAWPARSVTTVRTRATRPSSSSTARIRASVTPLANGFTIRTTSISCARMPRLDHAAFESDDPDGAAAFYERVFGARVVRAEGHPVMAYISNTGFAFHERGGPGDHVGVRVSEQERAQIKERLDAEGVAWRERHHGIATGLFFSDPDGRQLEAITYR